MAPELPSPLRRWRDSPWLAHVVPLAAFLLLQTLPGLFRLEGDPAAPWWRAHPEHWVYPLQTLAALALLAFWWRHYEFAPLRAGQAALALGLALGGIAVWIAPDALGWTERTEGFDPRALGDAPERVIPILVLRFLRLVVVAAFVEEIFWRGFLQRYLVDTAEDFWKIPPGTFTWPSAVWTTVCVVIIHSLADWPAALVWGALMAFLYVRTRSLSACVFMHAAANLILGIYILRNEAWGLW